jgi:hypothetical protein
VSIYLGVNKRVVDDGDLITAKVGGRKVSALGGTETDGI